MLTRPLPSYCWGLGISTRAWNENLIQQGRRGAQERKEWRQRGCERTKTEKNTLKLGGQVQSLEEGFVLVFASVCVAASICSVLLCFSMQCLNSLVSFLPSVSLVLLSFSKPVGQLERGRRKEEGERSVFIIEAGSADVLSSLSAHILPLALFSVSSSTSPTPSLFLWFYSPITLPVQMPLSLCFTRCQ